jgi:hypothetical protein
MENDYNLDLIMQEVGTKYGDLGGVMQLDGHDGPIAFSNLCKDHGIDMNKYFLIGISGYEEAILGIGASDSILITAWLLEKYKYGKGFDEIRENILNDNGVVTIEKKNFTVKYTDIGKYMKRFSFMVSTRLAKYISKLEE